jgi:hypothetical protein
MNRFYVKHNNLFNRLDFWKDIGPLWKTHLRLGLFTNLPYTLKKLD